mmetsp:Transcript_14247/g.53548  ORF Transcript_14247/g.53548 Transcript_14247/m.53548 type:complete len:237 (-) Transcript_14247:1709-2419(-)
MLILSASTRPSSWTSVLPPLADNMSLALWSALVVSDALKTERMLRKAPSTSPESVPFSSTCPPDVPRAPPTRSKELCKASNGRDKALARAIADSTDARSQSSALLSASARPLDVAAQWINEVASPTRLSDDFRIAGHSAWRMSYADVASVPTSMGIASDGKRSAAPASISSGCKPETCRRVSNVPQAVSALWMARPSAAMRPPSASGPKKDSGHVLASRCARTFHRAPWAHLSVSA